MIFPLRAVASRRALLLLVNVVATALTLLTGLADNAVVVLFTGRFTLLRARLLHGRIGYAASAPLDLFPPRVLPNLSDVATAYDLHRTPTRSPASLGEDRSTCRRVNSMSAPTMAIYFDDWFGRNARREQLFLWSISAPHCDVLNLHPAWLTQHCADDTSSTCSEMVLARFDQLRQDRTALAAVPLDFGMVGAPFLRCTGRPPGQSFRFVTDLIVMQSYWAGGSYQVEIQSSVCEANAVAADNVTELYRVESADQQADVVVAVPPPHWIAGVVSFLYSLIYLGFLVRGFRSMLAAGKDIVDYFPRSTKRALFGPLAEVVPFITPFKWIPTKLPVLRFHGKSAVAANLWMNHWLFIAVSILDSCLHIRTTNMQLSMGAWMLTKHITLENFFFVCSPITRITWITCLAHTVFHRLCRHVLTAAQTFIRSRRRLRLFLLLHWYIDAVALLSSFKFYSVALVIQLYIMLKMKGTPTISTRTKTNPKRPVYGGFPDIATLWHSEIVVDLVFMVVVQMVVAHVVMSLVLLTKIRRAAHNRILRILQQRYVFVGWDVLVTMDALGIEPFSSPFVDSNGYEVAPTNCTGGALLRQLYSSGPSGWVRLEAEDAFLCSSLSSNEAVGGDGYGLGWVEYPQTLAQDMGLYQNCGPRGGNANSRKCDKTPSENNAIVFPNTDMLLRIRHRVWSVRTVANGLRIETGNVVSPSVAKIPIQLCALHAYSESTWGSLLLVDFVHHPARVARSHKSCDFGMNDLEGRAIRVQDALALLSIDERKSLLRGALRLCVC